MIYQNGLKIASFRPKDRLIKKTILRRPIVKCFYCMNQHDLSSTLQGPVLCRPAPRMAHNQCGRTDTSYMRMSPNHPYPPLQIVLIIT